MSNNIIIATIKEWNIQNYFELKQKFQDKYNFFLITSNEELTKEYIDKTNPKYIFFAHWSWIIPADIYENYECVVFHMTDLPFGRGGSPLQNLLQRGIYNTKISALKVCKELDAGDIYYKHNVNIELGSAEEIFSKLSKITFDEVIPKFLSSTLTAKPQTGDIVTFKRRQPHQSDILSIKQPSLTKIYDFIRMLDAPGYPKAYIKFDNIKFEFCEVHKKHNKLVGRFEVTNNE